MNVHWPIIRRLLSSPARTVLTDDRRSYSGMAILVASLHIAAEIERRSHARTLGILVPTSGAFPIAALAGWMLGRVVVPLNYLLAQDELQAVIDDCGTDCVVTVGPMLEHMGYEPRVAQLVRLDRLSFSGFPEPRWPSRANERDLAALLYTSGTSGCPKGVMLSHGNLVSNIRQFAQVVEFARRDVLMGVLPQFHSFGFTALTLAPLTLGLGAVYAARFVPHRIVRLMREHRPTYFIGIPSMYNALLGVKDASREDFASFRQLISGGEPLARDTARRFRERFGREIHEGYGLTETSPVSHVNVPGRAREGTVGMPVPDLRQRIVEPSTGIVLPPGRDGEVRLNGPNIFQGYWGDIELSRAAFDTEGFFRTGDMGRVDRDGFLSITGRIKEMMIVGGENVFPREIEEVLNDHPSVLASGVVGLADPVRGEVPIAYIELEEGADFDEPALRTHCRTRLAGYKVPRDIRVLDELPRSPTGKVLRRALADRVRSEPAA